MTQVRTIILSLLVAAMALPAAAENDVVEASTAAATAEASQPSAASADEAAPAPPAITDSEQQKSLRDILETFVPSEEIDADKPVDFPTNI